MQRVYKNGTRLFALVIAVLGVAMVVSAIASGGGPLALGVVVGVAFTLLGAARFYLAGER